MRKVSGSLFISLDGVTDDPYKWQFDFDDDMGAAMNKVQTETDTILLGRVTYGEWAGYWPQAVDGPDGDFAHFLNDTPKYVFSSTLSNVDEWQNSTLVQGDAAATINALKAQPGKTIATAGSPTLVRSLLEADLLDELVLFVHPVVAGEGKRLFKDGSDLKRLELVEAQPTPSGVVILTYRPYREATS